MAVGDLTSSLPILVDVNDDTLIQSTINALNLAADNDMLFVLPISHQNKVSIFKVERATV